MRNASRGSVEAPALHWLFSLLLVVSLLAPTAESAIGDEDGLCNIFAFVPFTIEYVTLCCVALFYVHRNRLAVLESL